MDAGHVLRAWKSILNGYAPSLSLEITRECPLRCPGCYAYEPNHLGDGTGLRQLSDFKGDELIRRTLEIVEREKPLHISIVGGDPLVRYRELEILVPKLLDTGAHVQVVTSAFRQIPAAWANVPRLNISVSVDGLQPEHDERRKPATYERILKSIAGHRVYIHCTITSQMMHRDDYIDQFLAFWSARDEVAKIWFSIFTPQLGESPVECLTPRQREQAVEQLLAARAKYPKADLPEPLVRKFLKPPKSPEKCIFALTTKTLSADLATPITPCQFGGTPDCEQCGCYASMGIGSVGDYKLAGFIPVASLFYASHRIGKWMRPDEAPVPKPRPAEEKPELVNIASTGDGD